MTARIALALALFAILSSSTAAGTEAGVYLRSESSLSAPALVAMRAEIDALMAQAGYQLKWWTGPNPGRIEADDLVVLDLYGDCTSVKISKISREIGATPVVDHHVLPFSSVNCGVVNRMIRPALLAVKSSKRDQLYGRALGRVVAHEMYHALARTVAHSESGIAKSKYSAYDLVAERFDFDAAALSHLKKDHPSHSAPSTEAAVVDADSSRNN